MVLNIQLMKRKSDVDMACLKIGLRDDVSSLSVQEIRNLILMDVDPSQIRKPKPKHSPYSSFIEFSNTKEGRTKEMYHSTLNRILGYCPKFMDLKFEDIDAKWLEEWDEWMVPHTPSRNARSIHLRNLRAVFNYAINQDYTQCYPFRKFKIRHEKTRKRSLPIEKIRELFSMSGLSEAERRHLDCFKIIFLLCGINFVDLARLKEVKDGRIEYIRSKTKRLYDIKIEPEAENLIKKYPGKEWLLCYLDRNKDYRSYYKHLNEALHRIGERIGIPDLTTYYARHSWATIASYLDIPKETIAAGLGHGGNTVTDIYIDFDQRKVDKANRKIIDFVLYGKE